MSERDPVFETWADWREWALSLGLNPPRSKSAQERQRKQIARTRAAHAHLKEPNDAD